MNFRSFKNALLSIATFAAVSFASSASANCVYNCTPTPPPTTTTPVTMPNLTSGIGVAVFGSLESHTAGQGVGQGVGGATKIDTYGYSDELFSSGGKVDYKVDPNCGPVCGQQTATATFDGVQKVGAGALAQTTATGTGNVLAGSNSSSGTLSGFKYFGGVNWGKTATTGAGGGSN